MYIEETNKSAAMNHRLLHTPLKYSKIFGVLVNWKLYLPMGTMRRFPPKQLFSSSNAQCMEKYKEFEDIRHEIDERAIAGNDPKKLLTLKMILAEMDLLRRNGFPEVPRKWKEIKQDKWDTLLELKTFISRKKYYKFLFRNEKLREEDQQIKLRNRLLQVQHAKIADIPEFTTSIPMPYGLGLNTLFHRIYSRQISRLLDYRLAKTQILGPHLIIDCSYENYMNSKEIQHCYTQLFTSWVVNRDSDAPFDIIFCNMDPRSKLLNKLLKVLPHIRQPDSMFHYTAKNYIDIFPADKLVYLSPHSDFEMTDYCYNSTYIIGAFVDEVVHDPLSMRKAEADGLKTAKFPLDKHINWSHGSPLLPLNQCVSIMRDIKKGTSWEEAVKHVAKRKTKWVIQDNKCELKDDDLFSNKHIYSHYKREMEKTKNYEMKRAKALEQKLQIVTAESLEREK